MFDVSRREPRQLGSAGKFIDSLTGESIGVVRSVRCNSDGTCMSILADRKAGAYLRAPDERIHVYNLDLAAISSYNFGPSARYPVAHAWDPEESRLLVCETYKLLKPTTKKKKENNTHIPSVVETARYLSLESIWIGCPSVSVNDNAVFTVPWKLHTSTRAPTAQNILSLCIAHARLFVGNEPWLMKKKEEKRLKRKESWKKEEESWKKINFSHNQNVSTY